jgi:hypothetical protein
MRLLRFARNDVLWRPYLGKKLLGHGLAAAYKMPPYMISFAHLKAGMGGGLNILEGQIGRRLLNQLIKFF